MIIYHPAYDIYHCNFRLLRLLESLPKEPHEVDKVRILDFYLLFPHLLFKVSVPAKIRANATYKALKIENAPYEIIENPFKLFLRLESIQLSALKSLASCDLIDSKHLAADKVLRTDLKIPEPLVGALNKANAENPNLINFITGLFFDIYFYGNKGLKQRSGLMEYRYDPK